MTVQGGDSGGKAHGHAEQPARSPEIPSSEQASPPSGYPPSGPPPGDYGRPGYRGGPVYGSPSYPRGGGYPPSGNGGGYVQQSETNARAIGSLVASVIGLLIPFASMLGIVLGAVAINQIKKTRQAGYGMAVAAILIGIVTLVTYVVFAIHFHGHFPS